MILHPIDDGNSRIDLVEVRTSHPVTLPTPHCKIHGAMNCVAMFPGGKLWRCIQSNAMRDCRAGCREELPDAAAAGSNKEESDGED